MPQNLIKVNNKEKSTTIRISEKTKHMLEELSKGKETHEDIIFRLIKIANLSFNENDSQIAQNENAIGTRYKRVHKTFNIEINNSPYSIVCTFNDLKIFAAFRNNKQLINQLDKGANFEWEVDLEIANIKKDNSLWQKPLMFANKTPKDFLLLYLISIKKVLEETFDIKIYEINTDQDYFDLEKWESVYKKNQFSMESYYNDVEKKLQGHET